MPAGDATVTDEKATRESGLLLWRAISMQAWSARLRETQPGIRVVKLRFAGLVRNCPFDHQFQFRVAFHRQVGG